MFVRVQRGKPSKQVYGALRTWGNAQDDPSLPPKRRRSYDARRLRDANRKRLKWHRRIKGSGSQDQTTRMMQTYIALCMYVRMRVPAWLDGGYRRGRARAEHTLSRTLKTSLESGLGSDLRRGTHSLPLTPCQ
jgi:hypothetical protein